MKYNYSKSCKYQKPKGKLDTQLYPECHNTPEDRDIVKKNRKRKKCKNNKCDIKQKTKKSENNMDNWYKISKNDKKWEVVDNDFNQANYPDLIGKTYNDPPPYAKVKGPSGGDWERI